MHCPACGTANSENNRFCEGCGGKLALDCAACGAPLGPGSQFCGACGAPSRVLCPSCGAPVSSGERFCGQCGQSLERSGSSGDDAPAGETAPVRESEERRLATVLFCDLVGFTSMSERMDHEDVKVLASTCADLMSREVQRFGGTVTAVMGDAIMGVFGAPVAYEDDPERAVRAAMSIRDLIGSVRGAPSALEVHVGINTGEIMAGFFGPSERQDYTAMGDATNTASRLMSAAGAGVILVGELTYAATRHVVAYGDDVELVVAKGKSEPVRAWEVRGVAAVPAPRPLGTASFVGRHDELAALAGLFDDATRERSVRLATVVGPAGIGKTRLVREAIDSFQGGPRVLWGRCLAYGEGITYWPLIEILKAAAGIGYDDEVAVEEAKLAALLDSVPGASDDEARSIAIALSRVLGIATGPDAVEATAITKGELHWGVIRVLEALALERPTVLVFEDLHWAEPTMLEFVASLAGSSARSPMLVLATARPELLDAGVLPTEGVHLVVRLQGLGEEESRTILEGLLGADAKGTARGDALLRNAEGNPLYLEETIRMLASVGEGGLDGDVADIPIPTSVQGLIGSRLDLLPIEQRRLAQHGSVVGQVLWPGAVAHVGRWTSGVGDGLEGLVLRDVLEPHRQTSVAGEPEFAFRHILIRDVAYGRLPRAERSVLHDRCAGWIAALPGSADEFVELVAFHLEQACALAPAFGPAFEARPVRDAVDALTAAAEKAEHREGMREAHRFYERALELVGDEMPELSTELRLKRARMSSALGELSRADEELRGVVESAQQVGRPDLRGRALVALANVHLKHGLASDARACIDSARAVAIDTSDRWLQIRTAFESAALRGDFEGDVQGAIDELRDAIAVAVQLDDRALQVEGLLREGNLLVNVGRLADAQRVLAQCAELAGQIGSRRDEARATFLLGLVTYYRDGPAAAEPLGLRAHEWLDRIGDGYFLTQSLRALAKYALSDGRPAVAEERLNVALELAAEGGGWVVVELCRYLTEALVDQGRFDDATSAASRARDSVPEEDAYARAAALLSAAMADAAGPGPESAWSDFTTSIALMEDQQLWIDVAEARVLHADALARHGRLAEADVELRAARGLFESTESDPAVASIDRRLAALGDRSVTPDP